MTVSSLTNKVQYAGNGATTVFSVTFYFLDNTHVDVVLSDDATGVETAWVEGTHYTLTGAGNPSGGTLTVKTTPTDYTPLTDETLTILRDVARTQGTDYVENDPFPAETHEEALDKLTMISQQDDERYDRTAHFRKSDSYAGGEAHLPVLADRVSKLLGFDVAGNFIANTVAELGAVIISALTPLVAGTADAGTSDEVSRADHVHPSAKDVVEAMTGKTLNSDTNFIHANGTHQACRNVSGGTLTALTPVYNAGWNAGQGTIEILEADANGIGTVPALGILDENILDNANGDVLTNGTISDVDASGTPVGEVWADMDTLYVSEIAGELTNVRPTATDAEVQAIAQVLRAHAVNGVIFVQGAGRVNDTPNNIFLPEGTAPSTGASEGALYTKDIGGQPELFYREESDGDEVQITSGGSVIGGKVVQTKNVQDGEVATGTTTVTLDDSIPPNTEGDEYMTLAITPTSATNILEIDIVFNGSATVTGQVGVCVFQDSTVDALAVGMLRSSSAGGGINGTIKHRMVAGTTSSTTFKVRVGNSNAGTLTFNGTTSARKYGGVMASSITIKEITP